MVEKINNKLTILKPYCVVAGIVISIQSLSYIIFCICGIIFYKWCSKVALDTTIGEDIAFAYFADETCIIGEYLDIWNIWKSYKLVQSWGLFVWLIITLVLSFLWVYGSLLLFEGINLKNKRQTYYCLCYCSLITAIVSTNDFILGTFFITENVSLGKNDTLKQASKMQLQIANGIMITLAFKGFVLWIYNVLSSIYFGLCATDIHKHDIEEVNGNRFAQPYNAYDNTTEINARHWLSDVEFLNIPRLNARNTQGENNRAYSNFMDNSKYQQQQPLASIMKKSVVERQEDRMKSTNMKEQHNVIPSHNGNLMANNSSARTHRPNMHNYNNPNMK